VEVPVKNLLSWSSIACFVLAAVLTFAGTQLKLPVLTHAGILSLGGAALAAGIQVILTGEAFFLPTGAQSLRRKAEHFTGLAARLWGVFFLLFGLVLSFAGLGGMFLPGRTESLIRSALDTPPGWGILSLVLGAGGILYGLTRVIGEGGRYEANALTRLRDAGYRLFGLLCLLMGVGLAGLGLILVFAPGPLSYWLENLLPALP
jgi:hypothetical protein